MKRKEGVAWYVEEDLINDSSLPGTVKHLLLVIHKSINLKKQVCWLSQAELARKMSKSRATAQRAFYTAQDAGVIANKRIRTGKGKTDQHNEYSIVWERLHELGTNHPDGEPKITHGFPEARIISDGSMHHSEVEHASFSASSTHHGEAVGFQSLGVKGQESKQESMNDSPSAHSSNPADPKSDTTPVTLSRPPSVPPVPPSGLTWSTWKTMGTRSSAHAAELQRQYGGLTEFTYFQAKDQTWYEIVRDDFNDEWRCRKAKGEYKTHAA
jgi:hypothetical protein